MADPDAVTRYVTRLELALQDGFFDLARRIIDQAEQSASSSPEPITIYTSLASTTLPMRVIDLLERRGIHTVGDALARTPNELAEIPSVGPGSVQAIVSTLRRLPIEVADDGD